MRATRSESGVEVRFRRALWSAGARGFQRGSHLPGRPDVIFSAVRLAIFVHGCYWHRCPICSPREVKANADFWRAKFAANLARDARVAAALQAGGWYVETVWEHEIRSDAGAAAGRVADLVTALRH